MRTALCVLLLVFLSACSGRSVVARESSNRQGDGSSVEDTNSDIDDIQIPDLDGTIPDDAVDEPATPDDAVDDRDGSLPPYSCNVAATGQPGELLCTGIRTSADPAALIVRYVFPDGAGAGLPTISPGIVHGGYIHVLVPLRLANSGI